MINSEFKIVVAWGGEERSLQSISNLLRLKMYGYLGIFFFIFKYILIYTYCIFKIHTYIWSTLFIWYFIKNIYSSLELFFLMDQQLWKRIKVSQKSSALREGFSYLQIFKVRFKSFILSCHFCLFVLSVLLFPLSSFWLIEIFYSILSPLLAY